MAIRRFRRSAGAGWSHWPSMSSGRHYSRDPAGEAAISASNLRHQQGLINCPSSLGHEPSQAQTPAPTFHARPSQWIGSRHLASDAVSKLRDDPDQRASPETTLPVSYRIAQKAAARLGSRPDRRLRSTCSSTGWPQVGLFAGACLGDHVLSLQPMRTRAPAPTCGAWRGPLSHLRASSLTA